jgi:hypothetical protein
MILTEVEAEGCRDNLIGPTADLDGENEEAADDSDVYRDLAAERKAIMSRFSSMLRTAKPQDRRAIKNLRNAEMAGAKQKAKNEVSGRRRFRKDRKIRKLPGRVRKSPSATATR